MLALFITVACTVLLHVSDFASAKKYTDFDFIIHHPYANSFWKNYAMNADAFYDRVWDEDSKNRPPVNQGVIADPWQNNGWLLINGWNGIGAATTKKPKKPTPKPTKKPTTVSTDPTSDLTTTDSSSDPTSQSTTDSTSESTAASTTAASTAATTAATTASTTAASS